MKCEKCGAELPLGSIYCSVCGHEAQIVSDSSLLEEELLMDFFKQESFAENLDSDQGSAQNLDATQNLGSTQNMGSHLGSHRDPSLGASANASQKAGEAKSARANASQRAGEAKSARANANTNKKAGEARDAGQKRQANSEKPKKKKRHYAAAILSFSFLAVICVFGVLFFSRTQRERENDNSYEYQMQKAQEAVDGRDDVRALEYYGRALELRPEDLTARYAMASVYLDMEEEDSAASMLEEIVSMDSSQEEAYRQLVALYDGQQDYAAIGRLAEDAPEGLEGLFAQYFPMKPEFSIEPGTYGDDIAIELEAEDEIFYTTDGSDPREGGQPYEEPLVLDEEGSLEIQAVCRNEYGLYGEAAKGDFALEYGKPSKPKASPSSGSFTDSAEITLRGEEGSRIFYTWDGTVPTMESQEYTAPIPVPEGNNILSVILVDKHGKTSDVLKCNYRYTPEPTSSEEGLASDGGPGYGGTSPAEGTMPSTDGTAPVVPPLPVTMPTT